MTLSPLRPQQRSDVTRGIAWTIFVSRWLQAPLYLGLIAAQGVYVVQFMRELWHIVSHIGSLDENSIMLAVLGLVDVVMVANLLIMVIIGGYETFVSRIDVEGHPDEPEWLSHVNANVLKTKLAMAIIGISSIHLLRTFIEAGHLTEKELLWKTVIHIAFIFSALALALIDRMSWRPGYPAAAAEHRRPEAHSPEPALEPA